MTAYVSQDPLAWLLLAGVAVASYAWRGLGTLLAARINPEGALFRWVSCVSYALLAGLIARMIILPGSALAATPLGYRLLALSLALAAFFLSGRSVMVGIVVGLLSFMLTASL